MKFSTETFGKWILAGEHAVIRGKPALVFPVRQKPLFLDYVETDEPLHLETAGASGQDLQFLFWGVLEKGLSLAGKKRSDVKGQLQLNNSVPIGSGLGASAALCVAISRWFEWRGWIKGSDLFQFAKELENLFHGESSGVDIAVILHNAPIHFERSGQVYPLESKWQPCWYLSHSGQRGITADCVQTVNQFRLQNPDAGNSIDAKMHEATTLAEHALTQHYSDTGWPFLRKAINEASECFAQWGLITPQLAAHMEGLQSLGAAAVKPTGSGKGGFVLSLWEKPPSGAISFDLIPV